VDVGVQELGHEKVITFQLAVVRPCGVSPMAFASGSGPSVLILKNTGTNSVFVRASPPLKFPRFALTLRSWPLTEKPVPLNAVILNGGCVVTQKFARGGRIEICAAIPPANVF